MNTAELRELLEQDLTWRQDELRALQNALRTGGLEEGAVEYKRAIVVMTYAHLEGFVKSALGYYADHINHTQRICSDLVEPIVAASLHGKFKALSSPITSGRATSASFEGARLARARRETEFLGEVRALNCAPVNLPVDNVVSLDWNLSMDVFNRVLYRLGLSFEALESIDPQPSSADFAAAVRFLARVRNDVAHGSKNEAIPDGKFRAAIKRAPEICSNLIRLIHSSAKNKAYLYSSGVREPSTSSG